MTLSALLPVLIGLFLVVLGVLAKDPELRNIGIGFLGGGATTGTVQAAGNRRVS